VQVYTCGIIQVHCFMVWLLLAARIMTTPAFLLSSFYIFAAFLQVIPSVFLSTSRYLFLCFFSCSTVVSTCRVFSPRHLIVPATSSWARIIFGSCSSSFLYITSTSLRCPVFSSSYLWRGSWSILLLRLRLEWSDSNKCKETVWEWSRLKKLNQILIRSLLDFDKQQECVNDISFSSSDDELKTDLYDGHENEQVVATKVNNDMVPVLYCTRYDIGC